MMISVETDHKGTRWIVMPQALADAAVEIYEIDQRDAVFRLVDALPMSALHTAENISINRSHEDAVAFIRNRLNVGRQTIHIH